METFFKTAYRHLKSESGLPSLLPSKEVIEKAKQESRKVRLFCQGLECFREILYTTTEEEEEQQQLPVDDVTASEDVVEDEGYESPVSSDTMMGAAAEEEEVEPPAELCMEQQLHGAGVVGAEEEDIEAPMEQQPHDGEGVDIEEATDKELAVSAGFKQEQEQEEQEHEHVSSTGLPPGMKTDQEPSKEVLSTGGGVDTDGTTDKELAISGDCTQEQQHESSTSPPTGMNTDQKPGKYVLSASEDPFQPLDAIDKTPPASPGGTSSCSTLVDPSSRKVSPSDLTDLKMGAETSPTAVKDFAYSCLDSNHVRDPVAIVDDNTKLELAGQLKKKTAGEKNAYRKAKKQKAQDRSQSVELEAAEGGCSDKTFVHLTNHEQHGLQVQTTRSVVEKTLDQYKEEPLQNRIGSAECIDTAHDPASSDGVGEVQSRGFIQQEDQAPTGQNLESNKSASVIVDMHDQQAQVESQAEVIGGPQPNNIVEESEGGPTEVVVSSSNTATKQPNAEKNDKACLHTARTSIEVGGRLNTNTGPWAKEETEEVINSEAQSEETRTEEPTEAEQFGIASSPTEKIQAKANTVHFKRQDSTEGNPQAMVNSIATMFGDAAPVKSDLNKSSTKKPIFYLADGKPASTVDLIVSENNHDQESESDTSSSGLSEYSTEAPGPATLWGIVQTDQHDSKTEVRANTGEDAANVSEAKGPATLWGILRSDRQEDWVESPNPSKADEGMGDEDDEVELVNYHDRALSTTDSMSSGAAESGDGRNQNTTTAAGSEAPHEAAGSEADQSEAETVQAPTVSEHHPSKRTKTQKRNQERRRAAARKRAMAGKVEVSEAQGQMEEAATPVREELIASIARVCRESVVVADGLKLRRRGVISKVG